jgi:hypothetical protein
MRFVGRPGKLIPVNTGQGTMACATSIQSPRTKPPWFVFIAMAGLILVVAWMWFAAG